MDKTESRKDFLFIPAGEFEMGISQSQAEQYARDFFPPESMVSPFTFYNEVPNHKVKVASFQLSKYEVTNAEFQEFVDDGGYERKEFWRELIVLRDLNTDLEGMLRVTMFKDTTGKFGPANWVNGRFPEGKGDNPVECVSWFEAAAFARWSKSRLPSEAEWEYSARGADQRMYPWGNSLDPIQNWGPRQAAESTPVGEIAADKSPFGAFDLARNVSEWVADPWRPYPESPIGELEKVDENYGTVRGGSYISTNIDMRTTYRQRVDRLQRQPGIGFRLAS